MIKEGLRVKELIQVCYSMDEKTEEREVRSLIKAMDEFKLKEGLVITEDLDNEVEVDNKKIMYKPLWKWLLIEIKHTKDKTLKKIAERVDSSTN